MCKINNLVQRKAYAELRIVCSKFGYNPSSHLEDMEKLPLARKVMCKTKKLIQRQVSYQLRIECSKFGYNPSSHLEDIEKLPLAHKITCKTKKNDPEASFISAKD